MADIKVNMGVTGVAQFKSAMTQSRQAVKTLDAELKLNEAEYKKSGDAETYMAKKADILKRQIEEQKSVVKAAEDALEAMTKNGTDPASKSYQQMKQQLMNAKTALTNMQGELKNTGSKSKDAAKNTDSLDKSLKSIAKSTSFSAVTSGISSIGSVAQSAASSVIKLGQAIWNMATDSGQYADEVYQLSTNYGVDTDFVQRLRFAEGTTKITAEDYLSMMDKMAKNMTEDKYARLGIDPTGKSRQQLMYEVIDSLNAINGQGTIAAQNEVEDLAQSIFGKGFRELGTITTNGTDWFKGVLADQSIVSDENLEKLNVFNQAVNDMNDQLKLLKLDVSAELAAPLTELTTAFTGLVTKVDNWVNSPEGQDMIKKLTDGVAGVLDDITEEDISNAFSAITSAVSGLVSGLTWIFNNWETVKDGLKAIAGITIGAKMLSFINGLGSLLGGSVAGLSGGATAIGGLTSSIGGLSSTLAVLGTIAADIAGIAGLCAVIYSYISGHTADDESTPEWESENRMQGMAKVTDENGNVMWLPDPANTSKELGEELESHDYTWEEYLEAGRRVNTAYRDTHPEEYTAYEEPIGPGLIPDEPIPVTIEPNYAQYEEPIGPGLIPDEPIPVTIEPNYAQYEEPIGPGLIPDEPIPVTIATRGNVETWEDYTPVLNGLSDVEMEAWAEWWNNELLENVEAHSEEIEAMGAFVVSQLMAGVMKSMYGWTPSTGSAYTSNMYIGNMNMSGEMDAYELARMMQQSMYYTRKGYGS